MAEIMLNFSLSAFPEVVIILSNHSPLIELNNLITSSKFSSVIKFLSSPLILELKNSSITFLYCFDLFVTVIVSYFVDEEYWSL